MTYNSVSSGACKFKSALRYRLGGLKITRPVTPLDSILPNFITITNWSTRWRKNLNLITERCVEKLNKPDP